ncbi:reprolysin-like metallopeptidase [Ferruginibacter sp. SUN002]|uniref:reprolysin-like metallopeptidase n=1 Tax=Ferruginibacter sp. SUN002 TaxID=2937789 RepID=UPI003D36D1F8
MKSNFTKLLLTLVFFLSCAISVTAQKVFFKDVSELRIKNPALKRVIVPKKYRTVNLDTTSLKSFFKHLSAVNRNTGITTDNILSIPMPDGTTSKFTVWETSVMAPELQDQFPDIKTYSGQGIDDKTATITLDMTPLGFHAMILSPVTSSVFIDNYAQNDRANYISYYKSDFVKNEVFIERGVRIDTNRIKRLARTEAVQAKQCIGTQLRTYRLAVACTGEYARAATGLTNPTVAQALSAIVTTVNRVDGVYQKEIDVHLVLVANEANIVYTNPATDPFTGNNNETILIDESQTVIDANIGNLNYDMGHTFSTGGGGYSGLGIVCRTGEKATSITGLDVPVGDPYDIDYVSHEMGHALGADHPFNSTLGACSGNGSNTTNAEPGSGSSIMAYAGICGTDDLQPHSDPYFHPVSFDQVSTYTINGFGNSCAVKTSTGNTPPVVAALTNYTIPKSTPFILTGSATDANNDALTYSWDQINVGGPFGTWNNPSGNAPIFRSFPPVSTGTRYFPKLSDVINNTTTKGELLPSYGRTLLFRLTARDNRADGGGVCFAEMSATVDGNSGPFVVTYPTATSIVWNAGESRTITWSTANTNIAPVNCANVTIQLSTDGGLTYPITLLASTANDGTENITVPENVTTTARIRVMSVGNVFYDISNNNFSITSTTPTYNFGIADTVKICDDASATGKIPSTSIGNYSTPIILSVSDNPVGTSLSYTTNPVTPGDTAFVTLNNTNTLAPGNYNITVTGTSGTIIRSRVITITKGNPAPAAPNLITPADLAIGQSASTTFNWSAVPTATSYTLEISLSNIFATTVQSISNISSNNYTLTTPLNQNTIYYWRVKAFNSCGSSTYSDQFLFKTGINGCYTFVSQSPEVPKAIPAIGTITSALTIPIDSSATITDLNVVGLVGTHNWITDLTFTLTGPNNTSVVLFDQICNTGARFRNFSLNLDDQASTATFPCPPIGNITVVPQNLLSAFNGQSSAGTWTLTVTDNVGSNTGSLTGWGIQVCSASTTALDLTYIFNGNGNWSDASNWVNSSKPPATLIAGSTIVIDPIIGGECLLDIPYTVSPNSTLTVMPEKVFRVPDNFTIQQN